MIDEHEELLEAYDNPLSCLELILDTLAILFGVVSAVLVFIFSGVWI